MNNSIRGRYKAEAVFDERRSTAGRELRNNMRGPKKDKFDLDALLTSAFGDEKFINETLRDFLNTSDNGYPYNTKDMDIDKG